MASKTDIMTMRGADWDGVEKEVVRKLRLMHALVDSMAPGPDNDRIANDLFVPCLALLGDFCTRIKEG